MKILICPSDHGRQAATNWSSFRAENCSYEIATSELQMNGTNNVFLRCRIHGYTGFGDAESR